MANGCDDLYTCGVDDFSETEIRDAVAHLNYLIDNLIVGILVSNNAQEELKAVPGDELHEYLKDCWLSEGDVRELIVEFFFEGFDFFRHSIPFFLRVRFFPRLVQEPSKTLWNL